MKLTPSLLLLIIALNASAQRVEKFYDFQWKLTEANNARFYSIVEKKDSLWDRTDFFLREQIVQMHGTYKDEACKIADGVFLYYHSNKNLESMGRYSEGKKEGLWVSFYDNGMMQVSGYYANDGIVGTALSWHSNGYPSDSAVWNYDKSGVAVSWFDNGVPASAGRYSAGYKKTGKWQFFHKNGNISSREVYKDGQLLDKQYFSEDGTALADTTNTDKPATFKGGMKQWQAYLQNQLYFPDQFQITNADKAVVVIKGTIDEDGKVTDIEVSAPFYPEFDKIAVNAVRKSPTWRPAISHNRRVKYKFTQPVFFAQQTED